MKNFFQNRKPSNTDLLSPGSYVVELVSIKPAAPRDFGDGKPPRDRLSFSFRTIKEQSLISRTVTASTDTRSSLIEFVKQLVGHNIPSTDVMRDGAEFTAFLESLTGKKFRAGVTLSRNGRFNDIVSIAPLSEQEAA